MMFLAWLAEKDINNISTGLKKCGLESRLLVCFCVYACMFVCFCLCVCVCVWVPTPLTFFPFFPSLYTLYFLHRSCCHCTRGVKRTLSSRSLVQASNPLLTTRCFFAPLDVVAINVVLVVIGIISVSVVIIVVVGGVIFFGVLVVK